MKPMYRGVTAHALSCLLLMLCFTRVSAQHVGSYHQIISGVPLLDDKGHIVSAHGANIIKDGGRYYLFGEAHSDTSNTFVGFNCYSSADLYNWKFERVALPLQDSGRLGPDRVGERAKVLKCKKTGEYVMLMHADDRKYMNPCVGYATATSVAGPYVFKGPLLFNGQPIHKWDMGSFADDDGAGYLLIHGGLMYKLSDDFHSIAKLVVDNHWRGAEAPTVFKKNGVYYWIASDLTSWERNDNFYYTATALEGPWTSRGNFAPAGTLTWNSQSSFVLPIAGKTDTTFMFMGDRWSYPHQASAATYVWQPLKVSGTSISIPKYDAVWQIDTQSGKNTPGQLTGSQIASNAKTISYQGNWSSYAFGKYAARRSDTKGDQLSINFSGKQLGIYSISGPEGGYATVTVFNSKKEKVCSFLIDTYSKYEGKALVMLTPVMVTGNYAVTVSVNGDHGSWSDKKKNIYGSKADYFSFQAAVIVK